MPALHIVPAAEKRKQEVDEQIVGILRHYLEMAEKGDLGWVGVVAVERDSELAIWSTSASTMEQHEVVGRIEQLKNDFLNG